MGLEMKITIEMIQISDFELRITIFFISRSFISDTSVNAIRYCLAFSYKAVV